VGYEQQWLRALRRIVQFGGNSGLITAVADPKESNMLTWWPLYREGDWVYVRNSLCLFDQLTVPVNLDEPSQMVRPRNPLTEDGHKISEWRTSIQAIEQFLDANAGNHRST
jgi:hypothetical protein